MIGVRFRPCAISAYTKVPVYEFNNCRVDTSLFLSLFADFNSERLAEKEDEIERLNYIEEYLLGKLNCLNNIDKQFIYVAEYIRMTNGMVPVNKLLDKVCLSQRQFERQFKNLTGMTPKMFSSITRFSLSEKYLRLHPNESLFSVALDCGYYDHSHLIREFKRFGGASPQALMSNLYTISPLFPYYLCTPKKV
jgi:transcriptional regulator